jgi:AcrR family transcriptional regulator
MVKYHWGCDHMENKRKQRIIEATFKTLKENPLEKVSMRKIAENANLSTGAIYHFYPSKDELIFACIQESMLFTSKIYDNLKKDIDKSEKAEVLRDINKRIERRIKKVDDQKLHIQLLSDSIKRNNKNKQEYKKQYKDMIDNVADIFTKLYDVENSECEHSMASILLAAIDGIALQQSLNALPEKMDSIIHTFIRFFNIAIPLYLKHYKDCK